MKKIMVATVALFCAVVMVFGDTIDKTGTGGTEGYPPFGSGMYLFTRTIDFSDTTVNTGTAANVYQVLDIPAGTFICSVGYEVVTSSSGDLGEDSTCTIDIGDGSDTDGWIDGANVETGQTDTAYCYWPQATSTLVTNYVFSSFGTNTVASGTNTYYLPVLESSVNGAYAGVGKLYQAADTIDLLLNNNADTLKIKINAIGIGAKKEW